MLSAPPVTEFNPASHGVWLVALAVALLVVLAVALDAVTWLWQRWRDGSGEPEDRADGLHVQPPRSEMRRRHYSEHPRIGRDRRPNEPVDRGDR